MSENKTCEFTFSLGSAALDESFITSPEHLADELFKGTVVLGCRALTEELVLLNNVYLIRDEILFIMIMTSEGNLVLSNILISDPEEYINYAIRFYYENDFCLTDREGVIDLGGVRYVDTEYPIDVKSILSGSSAKSRRCSSGDIPCLG